MSDYTAEDYISFIEQGRKDKISHCGLHVIAKRFRELEQGDKVDPCLFADWIAENCNDYLQSDLELKEGQWEYITIIGSFIHTTSELLALYIQSNKKGVQ